MSIIAKQVDAIKGLNELNDGTVACVVTSPPYNIGIRYSRHKDNREDYLSWLSAVFVEIRRTLRSDGHFFLQMGGTSIDPLIPQRVLAEALKAAFVLQNEIIWVKNITVGGLSKGQFKPVNSGRFLNHTHEFIFHLTKDGRARLNRLAVGVPFVCESNIARYTQNDKRCDGNCWFIPYETKQRTEHPAIFPTALPERCIKLSGVAENSLVVDPFVGSGSTLVACQRTNMQGLGFDIDAKYVQMANGRLKS